MVGKARSQGEEKWAKQKCVVTGQQWWAGENLVKSSSGLGKEQGTKVCKGGRIGLRRKGCMVEEKSARIEGGGGGSVQFRGTVACKHSS